MTKSKGIILHRHKWTEEDDAYLRAHYPIEPGADVAKALGVKLHAVHDRAKRLKIRKSPEFYADATKSRRFNKGSDIGKKTWFVKGQEPMNKGKKMREIVPHYQPAKSCFHKGHETWNKMPVGSERLHMHRYVMIKFRDGSWPDAWMMKSHYVWQQATGSCVPQGYRLRFKDRNPLNCDFDNLELVTVAENGRRNCALPPEFRKIAQLKSVISRFINRSRRQHDQA